MKGVRQLSSFCGFVMVMSSNGPVYWCSITYWEFANQIGEPFKIFTGFPSCIVDGFVDPLSVDRFCLGNLTNMNRTPLSDRTRLHIGKGVEIRMEDEGDVWVTCRSDRSVFMRSYYLDHLLGRQPGQLVHKIYPTTRIKVFDLAFCYRQIQREIAKAQNASSASGTNSGQSSEPEINMEQPAEIGADDLRHLCSVQLSFVKGWGIEYRRQAITETPCWIEIQLHRALQVLDVILQSLPPPMAVGED